MKFKFLHTNHNLLLLVFSFDPSIENKQLCFQRVQLFISSPGVGGKYLLYVEKMCITIASSTEALPQHSSVLKAGRIYFMRLWLLIAKVS